MLLLLLQFPRVPLPLPRRVEQLRHQQPQGQQHRQELEHSRRLSHGHQRPLDTGQVANPSGGASLSRDNGPPVVGRYLLGALVLQNCEVVAAGAGPPGPQVGQIGDRRRDLRSFRQSIASRRSVVIVSSVVVAAAAEGVLEPRQMLSELKTINRKQLRQLSN